MRDGLEIELQLARGSSLFTAHGFNATDAGNVYARARELAERRGDFYTSCSWRSTAFGKLLQAPVPLSIAIDCPADCSN